MTKLPQCNGWRPTPSDILEAIQRAEAGVADLQGIANQVKLKRKFTLDGRLVGDIGELLLCQDFDVLPDKKSKGHAHDLMGRCKGQEIAIQVKLRRVAKTGDIEFKYQPQCLVVIQMKMDWSEWRIVYNGPGNVVHAEGITVLPDSHRIMRNGERVTIPLTIASLEKAASRLSASCLCLENKKPSQS